MTYKKKAAVINSIPIKVSNVHENVIKLHLNWLEQMMIEQRAIFKTIFP